jgi:hypothetical protein
MSYSIATLLTRNLQEVFGENDPARRRAAVQDLYTEDGVFYDPSKGVYVAATRSTASRARSGLPTLIFGMSRLRSPRRQVTEGGSDG